MNHETFTIPQYHSETSEKQSLRFTARARRLAVGALGLGLSAGIVTGLNHADREPTMSGEQQVTVTTGDTVDGLINEHVEHGASHTGAVRVDVLDDPANAEVFENGQLDPGESITLPRSVD